ncbi:hypothetical protein [Paenibacillus xylanexedens]|uniref:hypothetical protein n=1 Tax=Paenibacillus xylanexedens TaxID=528191 RepID=UPI001F0B7492|nr:hypothetical protein [Paenibacillus xylanexedens]
MQAHTVKEHEHSRNYGQAIMPEIEVTDQRFHLMKLHFNRQLITSPIQLKNRGKRVGSFTLVSFSPATWQAVYCCDFSAYTQYTSPTLGIMLCSFRSAPFDAKLLVNQVFCRTNNR